MTETPLPPPAPPEPDTTATATATDAPTDSHGAVGPRVTRDEVRDLGRLRRTSGPDRSIAGVAGGLGRHLDVDPVILKVAFVVLTFFGGAGLLLYVAAWLLVPDDRATSAPFGLDDRSRTVGLAVAGGVAGLVVLSTALGGGVEPFPVVVCTVIVLLVVLGIGRRRSRRPRAVASYAADPAGQGVPITASEPTWAPAPLPVVERRDERRRGPVLFWFTLALSALGLGVLGTLDVAGAGIPDPAYPALVVGTCGVMLLLGAFWGRAGGIILLGLIAALGLAGAVAAQEIDGGSIVQRPTSAATVRPTYEFDTGRFVLDLRDVADPAALGGRSVTVEGDLGHIEILLPERLAVQVDGEVDGPGSVDVFGLRSEGIPATASGTTSGPDPAADPFIVRARLDIGSIDFSTTDIGSIDSSTTDRSIS